MKSKLCWMVDSLAVDKGCGCFLLMLSEKGAGAGCFHDDLSKAETGLFFDAGGFQILGLLPCKGMF